MSEEKKSVVVKASEILSYAREHGDEIKAEVTGDEDLYPILYNVSIQVDEDTHKCTLSGEYGYRDDSPQRSVCWGYCKFSILGVEFSTDFEYKENFMTSGNAIDLEDTPKQEFWSKLESLLNLPEYNVDDYPFDEGGVSDEDLLEVMESEYSLFAIDKDGDVCAFDEEEGIPKNGYTPIDEDAAYAKLATDRPGLKFDFSC